MQPDNKPPVFSTVFQQPAPLLNPIGAKVPTPIAVEVFQVVVTGKLMRPQGWTAREQSTQNVFKHVGVQQSPWQARYRVAQLFARQIEPWTVNGEEETLASGFHLHYDLEEPSLCGSRFHQEKSFKGFDLAIALPIIRGGRRILAPMQWKTLCKKCIELVDRTLQPGDRVRVRVSGKLGYVIASQNRTATTGEIERYILRFDELPGLADLTAWPATELALVMFESRPQN